jgi:hypothetical protein
MDLGCLFIQALDRWEANGRPGARKTFAVASEYFKGKNPRGEVGLLDFSTTLLGRDEQMKALREFSRSTSQRVCIVSGRGGIGKSKLLHDWALSESGTVMFLKDEPLWHEDSEKEIPVSPTALVVDDAHRQDSLGRVVQLLQETSGQRNLKLILSTRPGSTTRLAHQIYRKIDPAAVVSFPEIQELTRKQSIALAKEVLGDDFARFAEHLAQIGSNSPLVIVAGGRLIASHKVDPSTLTSLEEFRATIFNRFLDELNLHGPSFEIDPPRPILELISALGPIDVDDQAFQEAAERFFVRRRDEILSTIDALANAGIVTPRGKPVRIVPDVLSDFILEQRCVGAERRTTHYADTVYGMFGAYSFKDLMRNLSELDWRLDHNGVYGLNLLDDIWGDIHQRFRGADEYGRQRILTELAGTAIYQPGQVLSLIRVAINNPVKIAECPEGSLFRLGQRHVLSAIPRLLEATARHPDWIEESVDLLWRLSDKSDLGIPIPGVPTLCSSASQLGIALAGRHSSLRCSCRQYVCRSFLQHFIETSPRFLSLEKSWRERASSTSGKTSGR